MSVTFSFLGRLLAGGLLLVATNPPAWAQDATTAKGNWNNQDPGSVYTTNIVGDTGNGNKFVTTSGGGNAAVVIGLSGAATDDNDANPDTFNFVLRSQQAFSLGEQASVRIPSFLFGNLNFPAGTFGVSSVTLNVQVLDNTLTPTGLTAAQTVNATQAVTGNVAVNFFTAPSQVLAAGNYTLRATLTLTGDANPALNNPAGSQVNSDFISTLQHGLITSFSATPQGLGDSRAAVQAPAARTQFGVDGAGVKIGQVEPGEAYTNHTSLAGVGKLTIINGGVAVPAGTTDRQDEHALAVAGIMASDTNNASTAGIAPKAQVVSAATGSHPGGTASARFQAAVNALVAQNVNVINFSATTNTAGDTAFIDGVINANPTLTFVKSAGNSEPSGANSITPPGMAYNIITVGALNRTIEHRADFSSFSHGSLPIKPDIVAPGEYILVPNSRDTDGVGGVNDFSRGFLGDDYHRAGAATVGDVSGTSFSAPHVAGAAALLYDYQSQHSATHDADHRVLKAVLLNSASNDVKHLGGGDWQQGSTGSAANFDLVITQSLDSELGAGALNVKRALEFYAAPEARAADNNTDRNLIITPPTSNKFWDLETIGAAGGGVNGTVDYLLGNIDQVRIRATLTWDFDGALIPLEMRLYHEGPDDFNLLGFDPDNPDADVLIATTNAAGENVKLFDFFAPDYGPSENNGYYLQILNTSGTAVVYGLSVLIPEPCSWVLMTLSMGWLGLRRRGSLVN